MDIKLLEHAALSLLGQALDDESYDVVLDRCARTVKQLIEYSKEKEYSALCCPIALLIITIGLVIEGTHPSRQTTKEEEKILYKFIVDALVDSSVEIKFSLIANSRGPDVIH